MERLILAAALKNRNSWELSQSLDVKQYLSTTGDLIYQEISKYYDLDTSTSNTDINILTNRIIRDYPKHSDNLVNIINDISSTDISEINIRKEIYDLVLENISDQISLAFANNTRDKDDLLNKYKNLQEKGIDFLEEENDKTELLEGIPLEEVLSKTSEEQKIKLYPKPLNEHLGGGVYRKQHIVVFARPDAGKTTFLLNLVVGFLHQGLRVLMLENEDNGYVLYRRFAERLSGLYGQELESDIERTKQILRQRNINQFTLVGTESGTLSQLNRLCEQSYDVIIVDQLRNIRANTGTRVEELEAVSREIRNIAKRNDQLAVSVTQAGDSGEGKLELNMGDVDYSNTGIQGACDLMIGIGVNGQAREMGFRYLSFPKCKLAGASKIPLQLSWDDARGIVR